MFSSSGYRLSAGTLFILHCTCLSIVWLVIVATAHLAPESTKNYCEENQPKNISIVLQPINTWSNVPFFFVSWLCGVLTYKYELVNVFPVYATLAPLVILHLGFSSFMFHMIVTTATSIWDYVSILVYLSFEAATSVANVLTSHCCKQGGFQMIFWLIWILTAVIPGIAIFVGFNHSLFGNATMAVAGVFVSVISISEVVACCSKEGRNYRIIWLMFVFVFGFAGVGVWLAPTQSVYPCVALFDLWAHALWHFFVAISVQCLFVLRLVFPPLSRKSGYSMAKNVND